ncbi:hypothetical protein MKW94_025246 [Papaver nudicaule]|uniref:Uncharacterized protein n=1 Tax=Papaver nudicaule TaxID=74823 RepID=A0AA42AYH5_PAPNU|nr:hypothetical protein [Papaver nudicaule]
MPEVSSDTSSLIRKKLALISISPSPSTSSTPKRPYSDDTNVSVELEHQSSSSLPRKVIKKSMEGYLGCWPMVCGCKVLYRLRRVESIIKITGGGTTMEVPFNKEYVHFDCPCGCRCEFTMNVGSLKKKPKLEKVVYSPLCVSHASYCEFLLDDCCCCGFCGWKVQCIYSNFTAASFG